MEKTTLKNQQNETSKKSKDSARSSHEKWWRRQTPLEWLPEHYRNLLKKVSH